MSEFASWASTRAGGLRLFPPDRRAAFKAGLACVIGVTLWCVLLNTLVFNDALPSGLREFYTSPLWPRTLLFSVLAFSEELIYRLVVMTVFVMVGVRLLGRAHSSWFVLSIAVAQLVCIWPAVPASPAYALLLYWPAGCAWGWLYWRHGWVIAALAHSVIHSVLDPILFWLL
jgi:Type II CAAX prenyl endopeptidase Rce1-like